MFSAVSSWYRTRKFEVAVLDWPTTDTPEAERDAAFAYITSLLVADPKLVLHEMPGRAGRLPLGVAVEGGISRLVRLFLDVGFQSSVERALCFGF